MLSHYSKRLIIEEPSINPVPIKPEDKYEKRKEFIISKVNEDIKNLIEDANTQKSKITAVIRGLQKDLESIESSIETEKDEILKKLNMIITKIDVIDTKEFTKFIKSNSSLYKFEFDFPACDRLFGDSNVKLEYTGPNWCPTKLFNLKQDKLRIYDVSKRSLETFTLPDFKSKPFCSIVHFQGSILVTGGSTQLGQAVNSVFEINLHEKLVISRNDMHAARFYHSGIHVGDYVYMIGGMMKNDAKTFERYSIKTQEWETLGSLEYSRRLPGVCEHKDSIYVAGGVKNGKDLCIEKISLQDHLTSLIKIELIIGVQGCSLASTHKGIIIFQSTNICLLDNFEKLEILSQNDDPFSWWSQSPYVAFNDSIYLLRFSDVHVFEYNIEEESIKDIYDLDLN